MRVERIVGRVWTVCAKTEKNEAVWVNVVADTPEQAIASFRDQYPGHMVESCTMLLTSAVVVPA